MTTIKKTGGKWDPKAWPVYFAAAEMQTLISAEPSLRYMLAAVSDLESELPMTRLRHCFDQGKTILLDSGVYVLSTQHAKTHNMSMDEALGLAPDKVDGFADLLERYCAIVTEFGERSWGYIEIDQGGRENKIKTRAKLEGMGFKPMPVYHPFNDGWDYFDYLAERYDRICFGNVVQAEAAVRKRLIATAWERRRKYPNLWIHALGYTANEFFAAFPLGSCDSSSWISSVRWGRSHVAVANHNIDHKGSEFCYDMDTAPDSDKGHIKAKLLCGYEAHMMNLNMHAIAGEQREVLGADIGLFDKGGRNARRVPRAGQQRAPATE